MTMTGVWHIKQLSMMSGQGRHELLLTEVLCLVYSATGAIIAVEGMLQG